MMEVVKAIIYMPETSGNEETVKIFKGTVEDLNSLLATWTLVSKIQPGLCLSWRTDKVDPDFFHEMAIVCQEVECQVYDKGGKSALYIGGKSVDRSVIEEILKGLHPPEDLTIYEVNEIIPGKQAWVRVEI